MQISFIISFIALFVATLSFVFYSFDREKQKLFNNGTFASLGALLALFANLFLQYKHSQYSFDIFLREPYALLSTAVLLCSFIAGAKYKIKAYATLLTPIALLLLFLHLCRNESPQELLEKSTVTHPVYINLHIALLLLSFTFFFLSFAQAIIYIAKTRALKNHRLTAIDNELPSLVKLQKILHQSFNLAWLFITIGTILVLIYSLRDEQTSILQLKPLFGLFLWLSSSALFFLYNFNKMSTRNLARLITGLFLLIVIFLFITKPATKDTPQTIEEKQ